MREEILKRMKKFPPDSGYFLGVGTRLGTQTGTQSVLAKRDLDLYAASKSLILLAHPSGIEPLTFSFGN
jgi:hypothetical protein